MSPSPDYFRYQRTFLIFTLLLFLPFLSSSSPGPALQDPLAPAFEVWPRNDAVIGWQWQPNASVTVSIDDPSTGATPDFNMTFPTDGEGNFGADLVGSFDLQPGFLVTVSDGVTTKDHVVSQLVITLVDYDADIVYGLSDAAIVDVWACPGPGCPPNVDVTVTDGAWQADFAGLYDFQPGEGAEAAVVDADGDTTRANYPLPWISFGVHTKSDEIYGWNWEPNSQVAITVDGQNFFAGTDPWGNFYLSTSDTFDLQPGQVVVVSDDYFTKDHTVTGLNLLSVNPTTDQIFGEAAAGTDVFVNIWDPGDPGAWRHEVVGPGNTWVSDFSTSGDEPDENPYDLRPVHEGEVLQPDDDGDTTREYFRVPALAVFRDEAFIEGSNWAGGALVTLTVDDPGSDNDFTAAMVVEGEGNPLYFNLPDGYEVLPGFNVSMTDGYTTKTHTVGPIEVTAVDAAGDVIYGTASPYAEIRVDMRDGPGTRHIFADASGNWSADFSAPGPGGDEQDIYDLDDYTSFYASEVDEDWDETHRLWQPGPPPSFTVRPDGDSVDGWNWMADGQVTVSVDGQLVGTAGTDEWGNFNLSLRGSFDLLPGQYVEVTDGTTSKGHTITNLAITDVDIDTDVVTGYADPGTDVQVWICWPEDCANRNTTADGAGLWTVDYSVPGPNPGEEYTYDISPGTWIDSGQWDEDGDSTSAGYRVPNPNFIVFRMEYIVAGWDWPLGVPVTLTIDSPATPENPDYTDTLIVGEAPWDSSQTYFEFNFQYVYFLQEGDIVTLTDGTSTKTHVVSNVAIGEVDPDLDTVSGTADPGSQVDAWICDEWGCANRHLTADGTGAWLADFANPGPGDDEQDTYDILPGDSGEVKQCDDDGDCTQIHWSIANPRLDVSYEHNWISISGFTPNGQVTYTIYDAEGGNILFGPVTGPVDLYGNGWISGQLTHTDLIPGYYVTAVDEATGEVISLLIQDLNLDYISADDDIAYGTTVPNATIELNVSEDHNSGFNIDVTADGNGDWYIDLAAAGYPIDAIRHASVNLYDAEGDSVHAQQPRIIAQMGTDSMGVDNFSKNADVTLWLYDAPGGNLLYNETLRSDSNGSTWTNLWDLGIDLIPGMHIVARDENLGFTMDLTVEPFTLDVFDVDNDLLQGTSQEGEWVETHVESLFSNWGFDAYTDASLAWTADYGIQGYDLTEQMWAYGWAIDDQGNWSEDHITGRPNLFASVQDDWIRGFNFSPERPVRVEVFDFEGGSLLATFETNAEGNTQFNMDAGWLNFDLQPGMFLLATDLETGKTASLTLVFLSFDQIDYDNDIAYGQADDGAQVVVQANLYFESYEVVVTAAGGAWAADFGALGANLTPEWSLQAAIYDAEQDATLADGPQQPVITANLDYEWVNGEHWTPNTPVEIVIYESSDPVAAVLFGPYEEWTDGQGHFHRNLSEWGFDLFPGLYVVVTDGSTGLSKSLTLSGISIDWVDYDFDTAGGTAPAGERLNIHARNDQGDTEFDLFADIGDVWTANFGAHDWDLTHDMWIQLRHEDGDGDATMAEWYYNPIFVVQPNQPVILGSGWKPGTEIILRIDDPDNGPGWDYEDSRIAPPGENSFAGMQFDFQLEGFEVKPGLYVEMTDGMVTKDHTVTSLWLEGVDVDADTVWGTAEPGSFLWVNVYRHDSGEEGASRYVQAVGGNWQADFSGEFDIRRGDTGIIADQTDEDGDATRMWVDVPNPVVWVLPDADQVEGHDWPAGEWVYLTIFDGGVEVYSAAEIGGWAPWNPDELYLEFTTDGFDIQPGMLVVLETDGGIRKELLVTDIQVTAIDEQAETVAGTAGAFSDLRVEANQWDQGAERWIQADSGGNWLADFANPPEDYFDLSPGTDGRVYEFDDDEDATVLDWRIANPTFAVRLNEGEVHGYSWNLGETVHLEIYDLAGPGPEDDVLLFERDADPGVAPWDPNETFVRFRYADDIDMQPGYLVVMSSNSRVKTHIVYHLEIESIDIENDTVSGWTEPNTLVTVDVWGDGYASREVWSDGTGYFVADFSVPGSEPWEQDLFDIAYDTSGEARVQDDDWDFTLQGWYLEYPPMCETGDTVSGFVYEADGVTPHEGAEVRFEDFHTLEPLFKTYTAEDGSYSCYLPEGDYRINASDGGYSPEFYQEAVFDDATMVTVTAGAQYTDINFTLDTPWVVIDHLLFNLEDPILSDPLVREAIAYGTDRQRIIDATFPASPLLDSYLAPIHWGYTGEGLPAFSYDPVYAAGLLDAAGWLVNPETGIREKDGQELVILYVTTQGDLRATIGSIFVENMADLGIVIDFQALPDPWTPIFDFHDFGIAQFAWVSDLTTLNPGIAETFRTGAWENPGSYSNPEADALLDAMLSLFTMAERTPYLVEHQRIVMNDLPYFPLLWRLEGPPDSDGDGLPDDVDACPAENPEGYDADGDGCTDTIEGMCSLIATMPAEDIAPNIVNSLVAKCSNAQKSIEKEKYNAAAGKLNALILELEAQRGKKVSDSAADLLSAYAQNVISQLPEE